MKDGVLLVNAARGGIVDEAALAEAIRGGKVAGAALDVFAEEPPPKEHPLLALEQVIATPHLGASTEEAQEKVAIEVAEQIADFLLKGEVRNAVNLPPLPRELQARLTPYLELADRLGGLASQLAPKVEAIEIEVAGEVVELGATPIASAAVAGVLRRHLDPPVNEVNAMLLAGERGIRVSEIKQARGKNFTSSVKLRVVGDGGDCAVRGTVFQTGGGLEPRVVEINRFLLETVPEGRILFIRNEDKPGVIGAVGTLLGKRGINVSRMQVALEAGGAEALQLWNVDAEPDAAVLAEVRAVPHVRSATLVTL
jgi:D-3-phosphoglycerate dehydrogenase